MLLDSVPWQVRTVQWAAADAALAVQAGTVAGEQEGGQVMGQRPVTAGEAERLRKAGWQLRKDGAGVPPPIDADPEVWASVRMHKERAGVWRFSAVLASGEAPTMYGAAVRNPDRSPMGGGWWHACAEVEGGALDHAYRPTLAAAKWWALRRFLEAVRAESLSGSDLTSGADCGTMMAGGRA